MESLVANWNYPTEIKVGPGRVRELSGFCRQLGLKAPLLVTDPILASLSMVTDCIDDCSSQGLNIGIFSNIKSNPNEDNIAQGLNTFLQGEYDGIIALGGGSALDAAKTIALLSKQKGSIWDFEDIGDNWQKIDTTLIAPIIAIPTTAGTGSEVGRAAVITDEKEKRKKIIFHPMMMPDIVILDPELTLDLPKSLTAATGMDALSHNLEAYCSNEYHPMAEGIALQGIRLIKNNLINVYNDGSNLINRTQMLVASLSGATAFQRGLGAMHALAHPLGALYDFHHGRLNAILMPYVLQANRIAIEEKIVKLALYLDIEGSFDAFLDWIIQLRKNLEIEHTLLELGIDSTKADLIAKMAQEDAAAATNPIQFTFDSYQSILNAAIKGQLF